MRKLYAVIVVLLFLTASVPAEASSILSACARGMWFDQFISLNYMPEVADEQDSGRAQAYSSEEYTPYWDISATVKASAFAWAEYGKVGVSGESSGAVPTNIPGYTPPYLTYGGTYSLASFTDSWTLTSASAPADSWGCIAFTGTLDGEVSGPNSRASVTLYDQYGSKTSFITDSLLGRTSFDLGVIWFRFGVPFELMFEMGGTTYIDGIVDLDHTAWISNIAVYNGSGAVIADYQLASGSGSELWLR